MLDKYLTGEDNGLTADGYNKALGHPACWPVDESLAQRAVEKGLRAPELTLPLGCTPLISVGIGKRQTVLWSLLPRKVDWPTIGFTNQAASACELARRLVTRDLPFLTQTGPLHTVQHWSARALLFEADSGLNNLPETLDGASFGLSFFLAHASLLLETPVPSDLLATAQLRLDGGLEPVEGLAHKIEMVARGALGVRRLLVAAEQEREAIAIAQTAGRSSLRVVGLRTLGDAFHAVFPDFKSAMRMRWEDPRIACRWAETLYRLALESAPVVLRWSMVRDTAAELVEHLKDDTSERGMKALRVAERARRIAARHEGGNAVLEWPDDDELRELPQPTRAILMAHAVQSAADCDDATTLDYLERVRSHERSATERGPADIRLLGATGRALAALGRYEEASTVLGETVGAWREVFEEHESSRPLCEWLRVLGVLGKREDLLQVIEEHVVQFEDHPKTDEQSRAFVRCAAGRSLVQAGAVVEAVEYLKDEPPGTWDFAIPHVKDTRDRWYARALRERGEGHNAERVLGAMAETDQRYLAELDWALAEAGDWGLPLKGLEKDEFGRSEVERMRRREPSLLGEAFARFVAAHYRY